MKFNGLIVLFLFCSLSAMEVKSDSKDSSPNLLSLKQIVERSIATHVKYAFDSGKKLTWFDSANLPQELASEIPRALPRYESEFAWRTIPYSIRSLTLTRDPKWLHNNTYASWPVDKEHENELHFYDLLTNDYLGKLEKYCDSREKILIIIKNFIIIFFDQAKLIRAWDLDSHSLIFEKEIDYDVSSLGIATNGKFIFCGLSDGRLQIIETAHPDNQIFINAHEALIDLVAGSSYTVLTTSGDEGIVWELADTGDRLALQKRGSLDLSNASNVQLTADGMHLVITGYALLDKATEAEENYALISTPFQGIFKVFSIAENKYIYTQKIELCDLIPAMSTDNKVCFLPERLKDGSGGLNLSVVDIGDGSLLKLIKSEELAKFFTQESEGLDLFNPTFIVSQDNSTVWFYLADVRFVVRIALDLKNDLESTINFFA